MFEEGENLNQSPRGNRRPQMKGRRQGANRPKQPSVSEPRPTIPTAEEELREAVDKYEKVISIRERDIEEIKQKFKHYFESKASRRQLEVREDKLMSELEDL